jgi:hypothetical protein
MIDLTVSTWMPDPRALLLEGAGLVALDQFGLLLV